MIAEVSPFISTLSVRTNCITRHSHWAYQRNQQLRERDISRTNDSARNTYNCGSVLTENCWNRCRAICNWEIFFSIQGSFEYKHDQTLWGPTANLSNEAHMPGSLVVSVVTVLMCLLFGLSGGGGGGASCNKRMILISSHVIT